MWKRLKTLKDLLWAAAIALCLFALVVGLIAASVTPYHGDKERPVMMLRPEKGETADTAETQESGTPGSKSGGLHPNGALFPLVATADAGADYLDGLTILCDSSFAGLRSAGLTNAAVWSSESCYLPMNECDKWEIR